MEHIEFPELTTSYESVELWNLESLAEVSFPKLESAEGRLWFKGAFSADLFEFPKVYAIDSLVIDETQGLVALRLPALRSIYGSYMVISPVGLRSIDLGADTGRIFMSGTLNVHLDEGEELDFSAEIFGSIQRDLVLNSAGLTGEVVLNAEGAVGNIHVSSTNLRSLRLPFVTSANALFLIENPELETAVFDELAETAGYVSIHQNSRLFTLGLPVLRRVGDVFRITDNATLDTLLAEYFCSQLALPRTCNISGNQ